MVRWRASALHGRAVGFLMFVLLGLALCQLGIVVAEVEEVSAPIVSLSSDRRAGKASFLNADRGGAHHAHTCGVVERCGQARLLWMVEAQRPPEGARELAAGEA